MSDQEPKRTDDLLERVKALREWLAGFADGNWAHIDTMRKVDTLFHEIHEQ
jgi:hypothetical protein